MERYVREALEYTRPWFWQGDFNFLWIYLVVFIVLVQVYLKSKEKYNKITTFSTDRVNKHKLTMQEIWNKKQEELDKLRQSENTEKTEHTEKKNISGKMENPEKVENPEKSEPKEEEKTKTNEKPQKKPENEDEKDEKYERAKRKADYFSGGGGSNTYKPSLRDRYPQVYKRSGG